MRLFYSNLLWAAMVCIAGSSAARSADSFSINVTGKIMPAACQAVFAGGDTFDYGTLPTGSLSRSGETLLPVKSTAFSVRCSAPMKVAFRLTDNRAGTQIQWASTYISLVGESYINGGAVWLGLGTDGKGQPLGAWLARLSDMKADGKPVVAITNVTPGLEDAWVYANPEDMVFKNYPVPYATSVGNPDHSIGSSPLAFTVLNGTLEVQAAVAPSSTLDLTHPVQLDGSVTIEMVYL
ncbi:DUF1120 domain-containing protein [Enterobacter cloacae]|uniref:DUF1120 domain-containing protein n=1 Tax=Enterobacter cloacae TaxID=550 RepID=UPI00129E044D|nr:DUF1120 domain-containing protein [Enterobacter cloacae]MDA2942158.1 DUF1120 domain-containing protein [Enterobacter cloacae]MRM10916.1 DUF1120 domain-containing protein [Enterobacter cloacae subsp. dissolvens]